MKLGMIGLGRMGANMAQRLVRGGHEVVGFDPNERARATSEAVGIRAVATLEAMVTGLTTPRVVWVMVPAGDPTERTVAALGGQLAAGDVVVDGGNTNYKDTLRRAALLSPRGIELVDCGTSGGIWGLEQGFSLMVGGDPAVVARLAPVFSALAPAADRGWGRVGPTGAGHFAKMVHNGIEYGLMQAYAEGFSILEHKRTFSYDLQQLAAIWLHGSVIRSWLLDMTAGILKGNPSLHGIAPRVADSGEGRWTVAEAIDLDVPAPVITASLIERLRSREAESFADKLLSAMRHAFGGHPITPE